MEQIFSEIALYGAEMALEHEREEKGLQIEEGKEPSLQMYLLIVYLLSLHLLLQMLYMQKNNVKSGI